jgi:F-type H+-transporting ATPase subunit alpha
MVDVKISSSDIRKALDGFIKNFNTDAPQMNEVGHVSAAGDGIVHVVGLPSARASELLRFEDGTLGLAMNLDEREIGVVVLGDFECIDEGQEVRRTGEVLSVPVGDGYLGRVVDAMGDPVDGLGKIKTEGRRVLEAQAPGVMDRKSVFEPLHTGIKAVDTMTPIGRGQRQLIIGDRQTGKTAIAIDTIINQKADWETGDPTKQVRCIYVAIGQKGTAISSVKAVLEEADAMKHTTIISAPASDSAGFKYLAAYTGSAIGQHWMYNGKHVLIVFDDLSKQSDAYRSVSLLLRRPPGREAYPGDVFYLHSRLLERCAKLSDELGGGSMTGLPIVETKANDVSAYIPTNVISITDGQIFLQSDLFNANQRPAVDVGISVSRVGGTAQTKAMKKVTGTLKIELAKYRSLESFSMFASDLDAASKAQLARGERLTELLKQQQYDPFSFDKQVVMVWAGLNGKLDDVPVADIHRFESEFLEYLESMTDILTRICATEDLNEPIYAALEEAVENFKNTFVSGDKKFLTEIRIEDEEPPPVVQVKISPKPAENKHLTKKPASEIGPGVKTAVQSAETVAKTAELKTAVGSSSIKSNNTENKRNAVRTARSNNFRRVTKTAPKSSRSAVGLKKTDATADASVQKRRGRPLGTKSRPRNTNTVS